MRYCVNNRVCRSFLGQYCNSDCMMCSRLKQFLRPRLSISDPLLLLYSTCSFISCSYCLSCAIISEWWWLFKSRKLSCRLSTVKIWQSSAFVKKSIKYLADCTPCVASKQDNWIFKLFAISIVSLSGITSIGVSRENWRGACSLAGAFKGSRRLVFRPLRIAFLWFVICFRNTIVILNIVLFTKELVHYIILF